ncbi:M23 family metallopeptidase [Serinicoccus kebangsaanensis]|uniref:M23 family metallopeptidase n=1 Tax=Serinicoccus kebangsaanensis TaxID=2602069 RepID=UPI00124F5F57|nr:M23 family metallopeptidase [Serinicoccus kebangsaanensis]
MARLRSRGVRAVVMVALGIIVVTPGQGADGAVADPMVTSPAREETRGGRSTEATRPAAAVAGATASAVVGARADPEQRRDRSRTALWAWPLAGTPTVVHGYDPPAVRWGAGHRGIDLAGIQGESVRAVEAGVVTHSGKIAGVGVVSVTHASGLRSTYQPVADRIPRGTRVARGDQLGRLDEGGHCRLRACLHLGALRGRDGYVDPTPLLLGVELTLLPVEP